MFFILRSEIEAKGNNFCPKCLKSQIKKVDRTEYYNKYSCWNKRCENKDVPFVIINEKIVDEDYFDPYCEFCQQPLIREFRMENDQNSYLTFKCGGKMSELESEPYTYNLIVRKWESKTPEFKIYEDQAEIFQAQQEKVTGTRTALINQFELYRRKNYNFREKIVIVSILSMSFFLVI